MTATKHLLRHLKGLANLASTNKAGQSQFQDNCKIRGLPEQQLSHLRIHACYGKALTQGLLAQSTMETNLFSMAYASKKAVSILNKLINL